MPDLDFAFTTACGYHTAGHAVTLPANVQTIAIPAFVNQTQTYKIEQSLTAAVVQEMVTRTHYHILNEPSDSADATLRGTVISTSTSPLTYDSQTGRASSALVVVTVKVTLTDRQGKVLYQNPSYLFREEYQVSQRTFQFLRGRFPRAGTAVARVCAHPGQQCPGGLLMRAFAQADRFVSEVEARKLRPAYVFVGDEVFFRKRCREAILKHLVPADLRDFSLFDFDLVRDRPGGSSRSRPHAFADGAVSGVLRPRSQDSVRAWIERRKTGRHRGLLQRSQSRRGAHFCRRPHQYPRRRAPHGHDRQRTLRAHPGDPGRYCAIVELARVEESEAVRWIGEYGATRDVKIDADAARELVDALGGDMMMVSNELEKLILYVGEKKRITLGDVETMVLAAKQRSLYELTDAISSKDRVRALQMLDAMLSTGDGDEAAIGHLYMLAKTFRQMLVILERNVRDQRMLWAALWQGFRVPPFAADDIIRQARRYKSKRELTRAIRLVAKTDLALRSNPPTKRLVLEKLILDLTAEAKPEIPGWSQEELPV